MNRETQNLGEDVSSIDCEGSVLIFAAKWVIWYSLGTAFFASFYYFVTLGEMERANAFMVFGQPLIFLYFSFVRDESESALKIRYYVPAIAGILVASLWSIPLVLSYPSITGGIFVGPLSVLVAVPVFLAFSVLRGIALLLFRRLSNDTA